MSCSQVRDVNDVGILMNDFVVLLGSLGALFLWMSLVAWMIGRAMGVPMAFGIWRLDRKNSHLTRQQYFWCFGVLTFGLGMFLSFALRDFLESRLLERFSHSDWSDHLVGTFVVSIFGGLFVGFRQRKGDAEHG